ncbi:hypothetical protein [Desulfogranum marinum]|uniref:hypothetical protein n=1 Tax=Desulfogranum marinum TaxID=453220 RepID=UPI0029C6A20C|nr:hypothetical protein [Desulfogranum marinum]
MKNRYRYPWKLRGPWYRRETSGGPVGRGDRPIIQKYASSDFVNIFLEEPQRSLKYVCEDFVNRICLGSVYEPVTPATRQTGDALKLFLDTHSRFYLVVCELNCQAPGCPSVSRDQVCEAGFVVRRYRSRTEPKIRVALAKVMTERNLIMAKIKKILPKQQMASTSGSTQFLQNPLKWLQDAGESARSKRLQSLQFEYAANTRKLQEIALNHKIELITQKWLVNPDLKGTGSWHEVSDETPQKIDEEIYPLYPLIPDPAAKNHSATGKTIYFGVVPTSSADLDELGNPKFDIESAHEIRCFVRRHKEDCPLKPTRNDCPGEIVWSEATESYKLAAFLDLDGSGHKPINIQLPDLNALKDQALRGPAGKGLNVRMNPPPDSTLNSVKNNNDMGMGDKGDWNTSQSGQICFFCIPLITMVALFVLRIFLPIVVFLFGLWFLLKLKLCIPPSFSFDAQVAADLKVFGPEFMVNIEAEISVKGSVIIGGIVYNDVNTLKQDIKNMLNSDNELPGYLKDGFMDQVDTDFDTTMDIIIGMATDFSDDPEVPEMAGDMPQATDGLIYFAKVNPL